MRDLSNDNFEKSWREAFVESEVEPSSSVWANIESGYAKVERDSMKKQVIFYQRLAAASVILVAFLGGSLYLATRSDETLIATNVQKEAPQQIKKNGIRESLLEKDKQLSNSGSSAIKQKRIDHGINPALKPAGMINTQQEAGKSHLATLESKSQNHFARSSTQSVSLLSQIKEPEVKLKGDIVLPRLVLPALPAAFMAKSEKKISPEGLWASIGFAAGSYSPGNTTSGGGQGYPQNSSTGKASSDPSHVGSAYSAGFAVSKRVYNRWVLQSGINYINQMIGYTSNYVSMTGTNQAKVSVTEYADFTSRSVTITSPYQINSAIEVVSLPVQTGYLLIDRKIGLQMNTGVAADFFVRNTLTDESGQVGRFSQTTGENSPYRAISWAGLLGTELSYKVSSRYRVSLAPGMRYTFNSVLKSSSGSSSNPLIMDIGFRFRYVFK